MPYIVTSSEYSIYLIGVGIAVLCGIAYAVCGLIYKAFKK